MDGVPGPHPSRKEGHMEEINPVAEPGSLVDRSMAAMPDIDGGLRTRLRPPQV